MLARELIGGRRADIADQVGKGVAAGIDAAEAGLRLNAGQVGQVDVDPRKRRPVEAVGDLDRHEFGLAGAFLADAGELVCRQRQDLADGRQRRLDVVDLVGQHLQAVLRLVQRQRPPAAIDDPAATGRDQAQRHPVPFGLGRIFGALDDRQPGHAPGQRQPDRAHAGTGEQRPAGEAKVDRRRHGRARRRWIRANSATIAG